MKQELKEQIITDLRSEDYLFKRNEIVDRVKTEFKPFFDSMKDLMLKNNEMVGECQQEMKRGDDEASRIINGVDL